MGILLVVQHFDPHYAAVLTTTISDALQNPWTRNIALSIETHSNYLQVLLRANVLQECLEVQRQGFGACTLKLGEYHFPRDRPFRLQDGFGLVIEIPMVVTDEMWRRVVQPLFQDAGEAHRMLANGRQGETDQVNMMARRPQPRRPSSSTSTSMEESTSESTMSSSSDDVLPSLPLPAKLNLLCFPGEMEMNFSNVLPLRLICKHQKSRLCILLASDQPIYNSSNFSVCCFRQIKITDLPTSCS